METIGKGFTAGEVKLIKALHELTDYEYNDRIFHILSPHKLLTSWAQTCFVDDLKGPPVEALIRVIKLMDVSKRFSDEYEKAIQF